jgi:hypothetical protein
MSDRTRSPSSLIDTTGYASTVSPKSTCSRLPFKRQDEEDFGGLREAVPALKAAMRAFDSVVLIKDVTRDKCGGNGIVVGTSASRDMWAKSHAVCFAYLLPGRFAGRGGFLTGMRMDSPGRY